MRVQRAGNGESGKNGSNGGGMMQVPDKRTKSGFRNVPIGDGDIAPAKNPKEQPKETRLSIKAPAILTLVFPIVGTAPYVQNRFANKEVLMKKHAEGGSSRGKKNLAPKDFNANYIAAKHISSDGWAGIPAPAFRCAMISACRLIGYQMSKAKLSIFVVGDGVDMNDGTPLVRIYGEDEMVTHPVRNSTGVVDVRARPMWREWRCNVTIQFDSDQFNADDVGNLLLRAGMQVGVGEGRHDSKNSAGMGWGTFTHDETHSRGTTKNRKTSRVSKAN